ncbi:hypothetical protein SNE40_014038 [Patella caerulea]|uniref:Hepatocyte growth factor receptor n=1 Tax=Patella caerulea TaxID=87958 RepID=A0AAN8JCV1_PATCE
MAVITLLIFSLLLSDCMALKILHSFRDPDSNQFTKLVINKQTGNVFLGALNRLHKLTPNLEIKHSASSGPRMDNPKCPPPIMPCSEDKGELNSQIKGLVIDYSSNSLIMCSSLFHGSCQILALNNITHVKKFVHRPLVPNNHLSCFMFIAPSINNSQALYIANTYSNYGNKAYRDLVPSISSNQLDSLDLMYRDSQGATKLSIRKQYRKNFIVRHLYGFSSGNFVYFVTLQKEKPGSKKFVTRINRLCQKDKYFRSFVEVPLQCEGPSGEAYDILDGGHFSNDVLYASFSDTFNTNANTKAAICKYSIQEIDAMFDETVTNCYQGNGKIGPEHYIQKHDCSPSTSGVDMCGGSIVADNYTSIEGNKPIKSSPLYIFTNQRPTALIARKEGQHQIIYIGTQIATLIKLLVKNNKAQILDQMDISVGEMLLQMAEGKKADELYVLTMNKVSLVSTYHCNKHVTCDSCMKDGDNTCGWCILDNRCTTEQHCQSSAISPHWIPKSDQSCASISNINPTILSYESLQNNEVSNEIQFKLGKLSLNENHNMDLKCMFVNGINKHGTTAVLRNNYITCPLPGEQQLPVIPKGKDHEDFELEFHVAGKMIVKRDLSIFDCRGNNNCTSCASSQFNCQWCYSSHSCIKQTSSCQQGNGFTTTDKCPRLETSATDTDILVHSGEQKTISVQVRALQVDQKKNLKCHFDLSGKMQSVSARISSSTLTCETVQLAYADDIPYVLAGFKVTWGKDDNPLDNPQDMNVRIYKCPSMVTNCGKCLSLDVEYDCGWCENTCTLQKNCSGSWLDQSETCPNPQILRFSPSTGPIQGVTQIEVNGLNLGKQLSDIISDVTVAGVECVVLQDHYEPSSGFKCETKAVNMVKSGNIKVRVDKKYTAESDTMFEFVDPQVDGFTPDLGPMSGGTKVIITGLNLDTGSKTQVIVGGNTVPVIRSNMTALEFKTPMKSSSDDKAHVEVDFGGYRKRVDNKFTYTVDPAITMIEPKRSILSGGTTITVMGTNLNLIQEPKFFTTYGGLIYSSACSQQNEYMLYCSVPGINTAGVNVTDTNPLEVHYGFNMDDVKSLRNISHNHAFGPMLYFPDPSIYKFGGEDATKKYIQDDLLAIPGKFRSVNPLMSNVMVYVGSDKCENAASTDSAITCEPPEKPSGINSNGKAVVELRIGNLKSDVGYLQYYEVDNTEKPIALGIILGVVLPIIAIIALLAFCVIKKHRKHGPSENYIPDVLKDYEGQKEDEEIGLNHVSVKADMNGLTDEKDCAPHIAELLSKFEDNAVRQNISSLLVPRSKLDIGELIGKGNFGAVYKAQYQRTTEEKQVQVAVKTLQGKGTENERLENFLQDCVILKDLQHPNILTLVGVCITASDDPILIMPFMATEDLKSFIREPSKKLTVLELLDFGVQIVKGMVYLEEVKVVHRNLAARNCIVTEDMKIQITDCGITKSLFDKDYLIDGQTTSLIKWMAPESIENFTFSNKSDVWSYGVVLWELLTRGVTPYPDVVNSDLVQYLQSGKRMKKPKQCTQPIFELIEKCWCESPDDRPTFSTLDTQLQTLITSDDKSTDNTENKPLLNAVDIGGSTEYLEVIG